MSGPDLPPRLVAGRLSDALAPMRSRLLRRAAIAHRGPVLDLGAGWGQVTEELARRARGPVVGLDRDRTALAALGARGVGGDAARLPFGPARFDLVFAQQVLMWQAALEPVLREVRRVLRPDGLLVALEPDLGGALEHPPETSVAPVWRAALARAGADPCVGRRLPAALWRAGFEVECDLLPTPGRPGPERFDLLEGLPVTGEERARLRAARAAAAAAGPEGCFVHVPFVCVTARPREGYSQVAESTKELAP